MEASRQAWQEFVLSVFIISRCIIVPDSVVCLATVFPIERLKDNVTSICWLFSTNYVNIQTPTVLTRFIPPTLNTAPKADPNMGLRQ